MRRALLIATFVLLSGTAMSAQFVVFDAAVTIRDSVTAILNEYLFNTERDQHDQLRQMAKRLSAFADLKRFAIADTPEWRIHDFWSENISQAARDYHAALNYGDGSGTAYLGATLPVDDAGPAFAGLDPEGQRDLRAQLATVDVADAVAISATDQTGLLRYNGRKELAAINGLESDVTDPSLTQSTTAVLDKISGAVLIGSRQREAREQLLAGVLEQLLIDSKRDRDTAAGAIDMQLTSWRDGQGANNAFVAGTGDALRTWRPR